MLFYATPILYSPSIFPSKVRWVMDLNPMASIINAYRDIFYYKSAPDFINILVIAIFSIIFMIIGYFIFDKLQRGFAEEV
jgi:ABC-2 type transport system permease protein